MSVVRQVVNRGKYISGGLKILCKTDITLLLKMTNSLSNLRWKRLFEHDKSKR